MRYSKSELVVYGRISKMIAEVLAEYSMNKTTGIKPDPVLVQAFADRLKKDNPVFDRERFIKECGLYKTGLSKTLFK